MSDLETLENRISFMRSFIGLLLYSLYGLLLVGCATNMQKQFERVQVGMEKTEVLSLMESPQRTQRWHGLDRWTYIFYNDGNRFEKEVHFSDGKATYVGEVFQPPVTASEQDLKNEEANQQVEALAQTKREEARKAFPDYEQQSKGTDTIRYVPQFKPVE